MWLLRGVYHRFSSARVFNNNCIRSERRAKLRSTYCLVDIISHIFRRELHTRCGGGVSQISSREKVCISLPLVIACARARYHRICGTMEPQRTERIIARTATTAASGQSRTTRKPDLRTSVTDSPPLPWLPSGHFLCPKSKNGHNLKPPGIIFEDPLCPEVSNYAHFSIWGIKNAHLATMGEGASQ